MPEIVGVAGRALLPDGLGTWSRERLTLRVVDLSRHLAVLWRFRVVTAIGSLLAILLRGPRHIQADLERAREARPVHLQQRVAATRDTGRVSGGARGAAGAAARRGAEARQRRVRRPRPIHGAGGPLYEADPVGRGAAPDPRAPHSGPGRREPDRIGVRRADSADHRAQHRRELVRGGARAERPHGDGAARSAQAAPGEQRHPGRRARPDRHPQRPVAGRAHSQPTHTASILALPPVPDRHDRDTHLLEAIRLRGREGPAEDEVAFDWSLDPESDEERVGGRSPMEFLELPGQPDRR